MAVINTVIRAEFLKDSMSVIATFHVGKFVCAEVFWWWPNFSTSKWRCPEIWYMDLTTHDTCHLHTFITQCCRSETSRCCLARVFSMRSKHCWQSPRSCTWMGIARWIIWNQTSWVHDWQKELIHLEGSGEGACGWDEIPLKWCWVHWTCLTA